MMVLVIRCLALLEGVYTIRSCCLYVICYYHTLSYHLCFFFINIWLYFLFNTVILCNFIVRVWVFLFLSMYSYCSSMYSYRCLCIPIVFYVFLDVATLTAGFPCFFLSCKENARVQLAKKGHGPHSSKIIVLFYVLFVLCRSVYCFCVNVYCTTATGWQPNCS